jgi:outer membrane protein
MDFWARRELVAGDGSRVLHDPILRGWGDIPGTARGGVFVSYNIDWLSVRASISDAVAHHEGGLASLAVEAKYHATQHLALSIGPEVTWANRQYGQIFFGIDAAQSQIAGTVPYRVKSGINEVGGSGAATYMVTDHWLIGAHVSYGKLQADAANSPVTTDKTQRTFGAFVMYRF